MSLQFGNLPSWLAAVGIILTFWIAFKQISTERTYRTLRESQNELAIRSEQASKVATWIVNETREKTIVAVRNGSDEPVYKAIVSVSSFQGAGPDPKYLKQDWNFRKFVPVVPPGTWYVDLGFIGRGMSFHPGLEIAFSDARGHPWVRDVFGSLSELQEDQFKYYGVNPPYGWIAVRSNP